MKNKRKTSAELPAKVCSDCIHYSACAAWNVGSIYSMDGTGCANYEYIIASETPDKPPCWRCYGEPDDRFTILDSDTGEAVPTEEIKHCPFCGRKINDN